MTKTNKAIQITPMNLGNNLSMSTLSVLTGLLLSIQPQTAFGADQWPAWRGPSANGSTSEGDYPKDWSPEEATWKQPLPGKGGSTPIIWKDVIYLTTPSGDEDSVLAINLDGRLMWEKKLGPASPPRHRSLGSSSNSSPVTDGKGVFVYFRSGRFAALELDGDLRWSRDLTEDFGPENLFWDQGSSPVVTDQHVILTRLHEGDSWVAGFNKESGQLEWKEPRNFKTPRENDNGYSTPVLFKTKERECLLVWGADHLTAHDASNGKLLWTCGGFNPDQTGFWPAISSPVIHEDIAVVPVGRDDRPGQAEVHGIKLGGSGDVSETHRVWTRKDLGVFVPALAEWEGRIYLLRNRGGVVCLDPSNGQTIWTGAFPEHRSSYYASPVVANGILYAAREDGTVFVARVKDGFELLSEIPMKERIVASMAPIKNSLIIRSDAHLYRIRQ